MGVSVDVNEEVFVKIQKKKNLGGGGGGRVGGQAGCKQRIEVFCIFKKKNFFVFLGGGGGWWGGRGIRVDVNEELKFL